jgi:hypothetical protein
VTGEGAPFVADLGREKNGRELLPPKNSVGSYGTSIRYSLDKLIK